ncbi:MFS transporter [Promicromonospora sukumoe]|uniref:EmrB/QacA subfamily drug resistance transporter n=1 Tax=Promicromonospora sukumoe TaxID=88382 RepID=A0A7W3JB25_9MICO|nr:MFS transporter [Promicromonospora sukumoe]MBA8809572.1 EmrB/QacA subfamily drug resistance transporter [Promicromonospora sukumoe]
MTTLQRRVLVVAVLGSFVSFLDGTVVSVALPSIADELSGPGMEALSLQQWVVDAYLITLGALMLVAGSVSDVYGRRRVLAIGLVGFGVASVLCALAPTGPFLVLARALQGVGGALLVPSSLALIIATFSGEAQSRAIGRWTALTTGAMIFGPFVGGMLVDFASWRWVFWINVPVIAVTLWLLRGVPAAEGEPGRRIDIPGAVLAAFGLAGVVFGLIEGERLGWTSALILTSVIGGAVMLVAFVLYQRRAADPMLPLGLFKARNFAWGNLATTAIYGALSLGGFVLTLFLQQVAGYSATWSGVAQLPTTLAMIGLSAWFGTLAGRYGPRLFMTVGPIVAGVGFLLMLSIDETANYLTQVFPGQLVFGLGLSITVAPLTAAILGAVPTHDAGIGSAVNNAVARVAGLVTVAFAGIITGGVLDVASLHRAFLVTAGLLILGGLVSLVGIRNVRGVDPDANLVKSS